MAKRYFSFDQLQEKAIGEFKPYGTLGSHCAEIISKSDQEIVVKGIPSDKIVTIKPKWTLGYDCGSIWAICPPEEIKDPLKRVFRELQWSMTWLFWIDEFPATDTKAILDPSGGGWIEQGKKVTEYSGVFAVERSLYGSRHFSGQHSKISAIYIKNGITREEAANTIRQTMIVTPQLAKEAAIVSEQKAATLVEQQQQEWDNYIQKNRETILKKVAKFMATIILYQESDIIMHPYGLSSVPQKYFPLPRGSVYRDEESVLWEDEVIGIKCRSYTFRQIEVYLRKNPRKKVNFDAFAFEYKNKEKFRFPERVGKTFAEKEEEVKNILPLRENIEELLYEGWY